MPNDRARQNLRISPTPFKSSFLPTPPSPFSPRTPLTPLPRPTKPQLNNKPCGICPKPASALPSRPLAWVWTCHQCHRSYHLGVTRRCLDDGHHFCAGTTTVKMWRKNGDAPRTKRHRACASEFDYQGWKDWARWRRGGLQKSAAQGTAQKNCWNTCDYPSECRWGKQFGVHTPVDVVFPTIEIEAVPALSTPTEGVLKTENIKGASLSETNGFWGALVASAERRKGELASSPLATVEEEPELEKSLSRDEDGDVSMTTIDPSLLTKPSKPSPPTVSEAPTTSTAVAAASAAVDSLKALINRKKTKRSRSTRLNKSCSDRAYAVPLLTVPRPVVLRPGENIRASDPEALLEEFAPLERVASRDSGYHSIIDARGWAPKDITELVYADE